jgi:hypothetical protein
MSCTKKRSLVWPDGLLVLERNNAREHYTGRSGNVGYDAREVWSSVAFTAGSQVTVSAPLAVQPARKIMRNREAGELLCVVN